MQVRQHDGWSEIIGQAGGIDIRLVIDSRPAVAAIGRVLADMTHSRTLGAVREALGYLDKVSPSGWHVERARDVLHAALVEAGNLGEERMTPADGSKPSVAAL